MSGWTPAGGWSTLLRGAAWARPAAGGRFDVALLHEDEQRGWELLCGTVTRTLLTADCGLLFHAWELACAADPGTFDQEPLGGDHPALAQRRAAGERWEVEPGAWAALGIPGARLVAPPFDPSIQPL